MGELDMACKKIYDFLSVFPFSFHHDGQWGYFFNLVGKSVRLGQTKLKDEWKLATDTDKVLGVAVVDETFWMLWIGFMNLIAHIEMPKCEA